MSEFTMVPIPERIDGLPQILIWEMDDFMGVICIIYAGLFTHAMWVAVVLIVLFTKYYAEYKNNHLPGIYLHGPYRIGAVPLNKHFSNGSIMEYHE